MKRTAVKLAFYLAICNLEALALSTDPRGDEQMASPLLDPGLSIQALLGSQAHNSA